MQDLTRNMWRLKMAIVCSVILSLIFVHGIIASQQQQQNRDATTINQERDTSTQLLANNNNNNNHQQRSLASRSVLNRLFPLDRDDYHSNIDLNQINEAYGYDMLDGSASSSHDNQPSSSSSNNNGDDTSRSSLSSAGTLIGRMFNNINRNRYYSKQQDGQYYKGKRVPYPELNLSKEDKDYSFVGYPQQQQLTQQANYKHQQQSNQQDLATRGSLMAAEVLRDLILANQAQNRLRNLDQLSSSTYLRPHNDGLDPIGLINLNDIVSNPNREKRRRCKMDPNLGVKNPSFCDTDAYFGAADYGARDVWDSAGR